jgi:hypothetical protein
MDESKWTMAGREDIQTASGSRGRHQRAVLTGQLASDTSRKRPGSHLLASRQDHPDQMVKPDPGHSERGLEGFSAC